MKKLRNKFFWSKIFLAGGILLGCLSFADNTTVSADVLNKGQGVVVYLDAGHDAVHCGARGNGILEEVANLKIAQSCKKELQKYEGVTVYLGREADGSCPYEGSSSGEDLYLRVKDAADCETDLYVSLHLNWGRRGLHGAEVYYPNKNYNKQVSAVGEEVSASILSKLGKNGIKKRGTFTRDFGYRTKYPDGSRADYYAVIRNSKLMGFTGIIVEHAYVSSASDAKKFLSSDAKLSALGVCDAQAIAEYYGLQLKRPDAVALSRVWQEDSGNVLLYWEEYPDTDYYLVYRRTADSLEWEPMCSTTELIYIDADVVPGQTYYYTVQAHSVTSDTLSGFNETGFGITTGIVE